MEVVVGGAIKYHLVEEEKEANQILHQILQDKGCAIGVDVEAAVEMSRFGILCLLQVNLIKIDSI
jgi:hypothetical protein